MRLGEYIRGTKVDCQGTLCNSDGVQNIEVGKVKPHPGYKPAPNWMNDICLLGLKLPARITSMSCTFYTPCLLKFVKFPLFHSN